MFICSCTGNVPAVSVNVMALFLPKKNSLLYFHATFTIVCVRFSIAPHFHSTYLGAINFYS